MDVSELPVLSKQVSLLSNRVSDKADDGFHTVGRDIAGRTSFRPAVRRDHPTAGEDLARHPDGGAHV